MRHWLIAILVLLGIAGGGNWISGDPTTVHSHGISYSTAFGGASDGTATTDGISCSGGFETVPPKNTFARKNVAEPIWDSCMNWFSWITVGGTDQEVLTMQRDTLMRFIESCPFYPTSPAAFASITNAVLNTELDDTTRFERYRNWLLSVVYLNTENPGYFCACVNALTATYFRGQYSEVPNSGLAILYYLQSQANCASPGLEMAIKQSEQSRHTTWLEGDTTIAEDTTLPPLDSIGLGILLHHSSVSPSGSIMADAVTSFSGSPNPFTKETELTFTLNRMTYVTVAIYDELGRMYWGDGKGHSLDAGAHTIHIDGASLPSGTLYARISTGFGEVKTVKLVKNE